MILFAKVAIILSLRQIKKNIAEYLLSDKGF